MESGMGVCPECGYNWRRIVNNTAICENCGNEQELPDVQELLEENRELKQKIAKLEQDIDFYKKQWIHSANID